MHFFFFLCLGAKVNFQVNIHIIIQMGDEMVHLFVLNFDISNSNFFWNQYDKINTIFNLLGFLKKLF